MFNQFSHGESQYTEAARFPGLYLDFAADESDGLSEARVQAKEGISVILYCSRMLLILSHVKAVRHAHFGMSLDDIKTVLPTDQELGTPLAEGPDNCSPNPSRDRVLVSDVEQFLERFNKHFSSHPTDISQEAVTPHGYTPIVSQDLINRIEQALTDMAELGDKF
jgi:hypothetical protein